MAALSPSNRRRFTFRPTLPWLWAVAIVVTLGAVAMRRSVGRLAWENYSIIALGTLRENEEFYRDLSLGAMALGVGLLLIAAWRTFGPRAS